MSRMLNNLAAVVKQLNFNAHRAIDEVNGRLFDDHGTCRCFTTLTPDVPFRVGHHFASELVNFGGGETTYGRLIFPTIQAKRIYTDAGQIFQNDQPRSVPLSEAQFENR